MARTLRYFAVACSILTACVVLGGAATSWAQPVTPDAPLAPEAKTKPPKFPEVEAAIELFNKREYDACQKKLEDAVARHSELPPAGVIMFQLFAQTNQGFLARMALEKTVISTPDDPEPFVIMGNIALQERRVTEAGLLFDTAKKMLAAFKNSERKKILEPQTISGLAAVAEAREKWLEAQAFLENLLTKITEPKDTAVPLQRLARSLFWQKKAAEALKKLQDAFKADPKNVLTPEASLGLFYEQYGDPDGAKKWMANAMKLASDDLPTRLAIGQWALETGKIDESDTHATKALQLSVQSKDTSPEGKQRMLRALVLRGIVALFKKDFKTAEKYFQDAHIENPDNFAATNNLALALCEQNDDAKRQRAVDFATTNYRQYPKNPEAASTLGWTLYRMKRLDEAERALAAAAQSGSLSQDTAYYLARLSYDRGRKDDAKALLEAGIKGTRPFSMRPEAEELLDKIKKEPPSKKDSGTTKKGE